MFGPDFLNPCPSMIAGNDLRGDIKAMLPVINKKGVRKFFEGFRKTATSELDTEISKIECRRT